MLVRRLFYDEGMPAAAGGVRGEGCIEPWRGEPAACRTRVACRVLDHGLVVRLQVAAAADGQPRGVADALSPYRRTSACCKTWRHTLVLPPCTGVRCTRWGACQYTCAFGRRGWRGGV